MTPTNETQPVLWSHAQPPRTPLPLFVTPPSGGERLIQPSFSLQTYPVTVELETMTGESTGAKLTQPATLPQAYRLGAAILREAYATGAIASATRKANPANAQLLI